MKIALVYDWVTTRYGGAEKTLLALHQAFPQAPLYTCVYNPEQATWAAEFTVKPSWLDRVPLFRHHHRWSAPLLPLAFESLDLSAYDVVISVTSAEAKGILTRADQLHISYILTPPRYLYGDHREYVSSQIGSGAATWLAQPVLGYVRWWDQAAAHRPDVLIPISELVNQRCQQFYARQPAEVIYPPVQIPENVTPVSTGDYYVVVSRLVPYKRIDLAVQACLKLGRKLIVVGDGPDKLRLQGYSDPDNCIQFPGSLPENEVNDVIRGSRAVLMPGIEDFGITACEAVAHGKPVILHRQSGAAEIIKDGKQGVYLEEETVEAMVTALHKLEKMQFNPSQLQQSMQKYVTTTFVKKWQTTVKELWTLFNQKGFYERQ